MLSCKRSLSVLVRLMCTSAYLREVSAKAQLLLHPEPKGDLAKARSALAEKKGGRKERKERERERERERGREREGEDKKSREKSPGAGGFVWMFPGLVHVLHRLPRVNDAVSAAQGMPQAGSAVLQSRLWRVMLLLSSLSEALARRSPTPAALRLEDSWKCVSGNQEW